MSPNAVAGERVVRDIDYVAGAAYADARDRLDVHMPTAASGAPVLVFFHGGALLFGDKSYGDGLAARLTALGVGVVSANYRLSPAVQHPAHVEDAAAAVAWTIRNIARYGGDPQRVYVAGHSAGAYLAALVALDPDLIGAHGLRLQDVSGAVLISPFLYVEETAKTRPKTVWGMNPDDWLAASVTPRIGADKPPMLLLYADGDDEWRKEQNERFVVQMRRAGNASVVARELPDRTHETLMTKIGEDSDLIAGAISRFVEMPHRTAAVP